MKGNYIVRYAWKDIWARNNRPFTVINLVAIGLSMWALTILLGLYLGFQKYGHEVMDKLGLKIDVRNSEDTEFTLEQKKALASIPGVTSVHPWTMTALEFYNEEGGLQNVGSGRTVEVEDPLQASLKDLEGKNLRFLTKGEKGVIVPFSMMKSLGYVPPDADPDTKSTWGIPSLPSHLNTKVREANGLLRDLKIPIVGITRQFTGDNYLITKEFYDFLGHCTYPYSNATLYIRSRDDLSIVLQKIQDLGGLEADCALKDNLADYEQLENVFPVAIAGICLALFVFTGVVLFSNFYSLVLRKKKEIGILKANGASSRLVSLLFLTETVIIGTFAIALGIGLGALSGQPVGRYIQQQLGSAELGLFLVSWESLGIIFVLGIMFCCLVTLRPVQMAVHIDPDQVIRV
jgi:ABC-type antimicrobial peptide transport system permease subunit